MKKLDPKSLATLPDRMFSIESPKAIKSRGFGYINAIMYLAPHDLGGVGNLCPKASPACRALCLGWYSGQSSMVKSESVADRNNVRKSRALKSQWFMADRGEFMRRVVLDIARNVARANRDRLKLAVRLNGSTDISFEGIRVAIDAPTSRKIAGLCGLTVEPGIYANVFDVFPSIQFLDYTKIATRFDRALPGNYSLTFSRSENNEKEAQNVLKAGHNVAAVFAAVPPSWHEWRVIDGDKHDLRFLDPRGVVVGLTPKGPRAKRDNTGFVIRA